MTTDTAGLLREALVDAMETLARIATWSGVLHNAQNVASAGHDRARAALAAEPSGPVVHPVSPEVAKAIQRVQRGIAKRAGAASPEREGLLDLLYMIPEPDEYAYIEARVGSENYRAESRLIIDRRGRDKSGRSGYENHPANDWLQRLAIFAAKVRAASPPDTGVADGQPTIDGVLAEEERP